MNAITNIVLCQTEQEGDVPDRGLMNQVAVTWESDSHLAATMRNTHSEFICFQVTVTFGGDCHLSGASSIVRQRGQREVDIINLPCIKLYSGRGTTAIIGQRKDAAHQLAGPPCASRVAITRQRPSDLLAA